ncbi:hypothetical protein RN001_007556 [Aquatica leii]|uniref:DDE Tnp4 domain-containing protein n=1 Tax=Aquatica leii TaxID=1421715 RepID=A0AAN7Q4E9_9COLE|nr:hypothetical protein RN001_007556 [Aquatica leii]
MQYYILLGDSRYPNLNYLITPLLQPMIAAESLFNQSHIRTRNVIERPFGVWKRRFPCLALGLRVKLETTQNIIVATAILHNIAIDRNDVLPVVDPEIQQAINNAIVLENINMMKHGKNIRRNELIHTYFFRRL